MEKITQQNLQQKLGFTAACSIVIGRIIGSGIFRTPGPIFIVVCGLSLSQSYEQGSIPPERLSIGLFFLAWIIGGVATFLGSLCYAELVSFLPRSGGPYAYLKEAYPEFWTFLRGWAMFFVSETASIVAVASVFAGYTALMWEKIVGISISRWMEGGTALALIWLLTLANCFGVTLSGIFQNVISFLKLFSLLAMALLLFSNGSHEHFLGSFWPETWGIETIIALGAAMRYTFFAYSGWEGATYMAEEVKNPRKNLPLSLFLGIGLVTVIYLLVNVAYVFQIGPEQIILSRKQIAGAAVKSAAGPIGILVLTSIVMLSTAGNVSTQILVKARTWHAMARDRLFFSPMAKLHPLYQTPNMALLYQAVWASCLLIPAYLSENSYETIVDFFSFTSGLFNFSTFLAVWILRKKMPNAERKFRVPFLPLILGIVLFIQFWFLSVTLYDRPWESLLGIFITLSGLVYYFFKKRSQQKDVQ